MSEKNNNIDDIFNIVAGKILKKHREEKKLSLEEVVKKMKENISRQSLYKYENNKARLKTNTFFDLCYAMNLNPKDVFREINEQTTIISNKLTNHEANLDNFAEIISEYLIGLDYNSFLEENDLLEKDLKTANFDELEMLFSKHKDILTEDDKEYIKFIIEKRKKELDRDSEEK